MSISDEDMNEINSIIQSKSNLSLIRLEDSKRMAIESINKNKEFMKKLIENRQKEFYWLPDLSMAGFASKDQIKKNILDWHAKSGVKIKKERTINWRNPNYINERNPEDADLKKWNN